MRVALLFLIPTLASCFAPTTHFRPNPSTTCSTNAIDEASADVVSTSENVLKRVDDLFLRRVVRVLNHAPVLVTLKALGEAAGSSRFGVDAAASAFKTASPALLTAPTWVNLIWPVICALQLASVAKSAQASDQDELSQGDITTMAASNFAATRAIQSATPLRWVAVTAVVSGYSARNGGSSDINIHNAAMQLMSSMATVSTILGVANALPSLVPFLGGQAEIVAGLGLVAYYGLVTRSGNGAIRKLVNAGVIGGILWSKISGGAFALTRANLLNPGTLITVGTAYVALEAVKRAMDAIADV